MRARVARLGAAAAWLPLPLACHVAFSWIGYNPTDDGWLQAVARRLADGEVPHRDFIFVRPALSAYFQVPLVWWGGDSVIWLSRLWGWLTLGGVAWLWSARAGAAPLARRYALYALALFLGAHTFPVAAWHSLDGMLLATAGVALVIRGTRGSEAAGYVAIGAAALCRQNFAVFAPLLVLASGPALAPPRWLRAAGWTAAPVVLYVSAIAARGGGADLAHQVLATGGAFAHVAVAPYRDPWAIGGFVTGVIVAAALAIVSSKPSVSLPGGARWIPAATFLVAGAYVASSLWRGPHAYRESSVALLMVTAGVVAGVVVRGVPRTDRIALVAGVALAWVTSLSIGYNTPALMSGVAALLLWRALHVAGASHEAPPGMAAALGVVLAITAVGLWHARVTYPYRDRPAAELHADVGQVLRGGAGMRTNEVTYASLGELQGLTARFESERRRYAILTDGAAPWIRSASRNPLSCEWAQDTELGGSDALFARVVGDLRRLPPGSRIVVQKFVVPDYAWRLTPVDPGWSFYRVQHWVRAHARKVDETRFYDIYEPPA